MRDINRILDVLISLRTLWEQYPDWRLGQLINNIQRKFGNDLFYVEDEKLIKMIEQLIKEGF